MEHPMADPEPDPVDAHNPNNPPTNVPPEMATMLDALLEQRWATFQRLAAQHLDGIAKPRDKPLLPAKPNKFDGTTGSVEQWIFEVELFFNAGRQDDHTARINFAASMLNGSASQWWRYVVESNEPIATWTEFRSELINQFKGIDSQKDASNRLVYCQQRHSVTGYFKEFTMLTLSIPGMTEEEKLDRFVRGLRPHLQREVLLREPHTLQEACHIAYKLETVLSQIRGSNPSPTPRPTYRPTY